jgi:hypothetical protein
MSKVEMEIRESYEFRATTQLSLVCLPAAAGISVLASGSVLILDTSYLILK